MRTILLLLMCLSVNADWRSTQLVYLFNGTIPGVALTSTRIHNIDHAAGGYSSVQIGQVGGVDTNYCTGFLDAMDPCGSIQNCEWIFSDSNVTNDTLLVTTCRPLTNGICYIATNFTVGTAVSWYSIARSNWYSGSIDSISSLHVATLADASTVYMGTIVLSGTQVIGGDSGSPVFTSNGDFLCSMAAAGGGSTSIGYFAYPEGAAYRPRSGGISGLSALFNSDPDW